MNDRRRATLNQARDTIRKAWGYVDQALDGEQDCLDNMPENLLSSERCERMEDAIASLEAAIEHLDSAVNCIDEAIA